MNRGRRNLADMLMTLVRVGFADAMAYRSETIIWFLSTTTPLIMMVLWTAVAAEAPVGRYGQPEFVAYFLITLVVRLVTGAWVVWEMNMDVRQGTLAMRLLRPVHPFLHYAAENIGAWPLRVATCLPVLVVFFFTVGASRLAHDPRLWVMMPFAYFGAWALTFTAMLAIGTLSFFWSSSLNIFYVWMSLYFVMSGYVVPLDLFPPVLRTVAAWMPFRYIIGFPVEVTLGLVDAGTAASLLARQWAFIAFFTALAAVLWRGGVRRFEAFGG